LADQRRAEELARQQLAEQELAAQQRARQLADQRQAEERAQQAAARQRAEELARQQAAEAEAARRLARQDAAPGQPSLDPGGSMARAEPGAGAGSAAGTGLGAGAGSRGLPGKDFGSRARELLRGIDIAKAVPPALADAARRDVPLRLYIDSVRQKIERNAVVSQVQLSSGAVHTDPVVSIAIRSDGSVEDVTILRSSGRPDIDDIVRRIVGLNARYSAFPPNVAAHYDVIELRRIWTFAEVLRLVEEVR
jgi:outer membrane biosynthesis protein TonB